MAPNSTTSRSWSVSHHHRSPVRLRARPSSDTTVSPRGWIVTLDPVMAGCEVGGDAEFVVELRAEHGVGVLHHLGVPFGGFGNHASTACSAGQLAPGAMASCSKVSRAMAAEDEYSSAPRRWAMRSSAIVAPPSRMVVPLAAVRIA